MTSSSSDTAVAVPVTWEGTAPADLVGRYVSVRPYYHVPTSRSSTSPARSPYTFEARVVEVLANMVVVEFTWVTDSAPWKPRAAFWPGELHQAHGACPCPACVSGGEGIDALRGA